MTATCGRGPPNQLAGSWFPTGFHGHFRNKTRNDFICEYRQLARPQPPSRFIFRSSKPANQNVFSHHDNRHSFLSDAMYFEQGLGRRRIKRSTFAYNPELLTWVPTQKHLERPPLTSYQKIHQYGQADQIIISPIKTSFDLEPPTTTYRYVHGQANPNKDRLEAMSREALSTSFFNRKSRPSSVSGRESVASCLSWHTPQPPSTPTPTPNRTVIRNGYRVPAATEICPPPSQPLAAPAPESTPPSEPATLSPGEN